MVNIIIVEDELVAAEYLKEILSENAFNVMDIIDNGKEAMQKIKKLKPDIVLMDIMLKGNISGNEVALYLKQHAPSIAIIFLTAYADNEMVESAMESNTYSYLMKPYNEKEIVNTLKVVFARITQEKKNLRYNNSDGLIEIGNNLVFDMNLKRLFQDDKELHLGSNALKLLELLCKQPNISVSNEHISLHIWGEVKNLITLRTQIYRLRTIIGKNIIYNSNGLGYMLKID